MNPPSYGTAEPLACSMLGSVPVPDPAQGTDPGRIAVVCSIDRDGDYRGRAVPAGTLAWGHGKATRGGLSVHWYSMESPDGEILALARAKPLGVTASVPLPVAAGAKLVIRRDAHDAVPGP